LALAFSSRTALISSSLSPSKSINSGSVFSSFAVSPYTGRIMSFVTLDDGVEISPVVADGITILTTNDADLIAYK
jgi:hypothetical protein